MAYSTCYSYHIHYVRYYFRVSAQTGRHYPNDPDLFYRGIPDVRVVGLRFDQGGFAAFVLLCGIVVNAGIYLINEMDNWRVSSNKKEISLYLKAFNHKIIPISLTILSTILGLIPFLYDGPEEVFWFAFAVAAISGTLFSVIALAIFLPVFLPMRHKPRKYYEPTTPYSIALPAATAFSRGLLVSAYVSPRYADARTAGKYAFDPACDGYDPVSGSMHVFTLSSAPADNCDRPACSHAFYRGYDQ